MPIHPSGEVRKKGTLGSPYAVRDYYAIDPKYGTKDDLHQLVAEAHRRRMKVILDMVANHTAWDSVMMAHPNFYKHDKNGHIISPYDWTDVDGYRCDAAGEVPTDFWEEARTELDRVKPGIMMLAEASKPELLRSAFDIDYSWPLLHTLDSVMMHGEPATAVRATIDEQRLLFPKRALHMRISDDHDEERAIARYGLPGAIAASALVFTMDGVPLLYNGTEVGDDTESGGPALFEPLKILWQMGDRRPQFVKFYPEIIALRRQHRALQQGKLVWAHNSDERHVVSYVRESGGAEFLWW